MNWANHHSTKKLRVAHYVCLRLEMAWLNSFIF